MSEESKFLVISLMDYIVKHPELAYFLSKPINATTLEQLINKVDQGFTLDSIELVSILTIADHVYFVAKK